WSHRSLGYRYWLAASLRQDEIPGSSAFHGIAGGAGKGVSPPGPLLAGRSESEIAVEDVLDEAFLAHAVQGCLELLHH
ncbi:hypothetical protein, partial [Streptococcus pneumoniae]|uniref:hypothetical protein n=1 Tax=Streptococcus pneumoniae TaxID=1313 RepID=UPI001954D1AD